MLFILTLLKLELLVNTMEWGCQLLATKMLQTLFLIVLH